MRELRKKDFDVEWIGFVKLTKEAEETVEDEVTAMDNEGVEEFYDEYQTESKYRAEHPGCTPQ